MKKLGIALGGGGAKGVAHVLMLEALEELGWQPHCISGTSIGAIVGALYASGNSAKALREDLTAASLSENGSFIDDIFNKDLSRCELRGQYTYFTSTGIRAYLNKYTVPGLLFTY